MEVKLREERHIGEEQFGFMPGKGTTDAIFALRHVMEKQQEKRKGLHMVLIDLEEAYDSTTSESLEIFESEGNTGKVL